MKKVNIDKERSEWIFGDLEAEDNGKNKLCNNVLKSFPQQK